MNWTASSSSDCSWRISYTIPTSDWPMFVHLSNNMGWNKSWFCVFIYIFIYIYICICTNTQTYVYIYICIHIQHWWEDVPPHFRWNRPNKKCIRRGAWNMMDMVLVVAYAARGCIQCVIWVDGIDPIDGLMGWTWGTKNASTKNNFSLIIPKNSTILYLQLILTSFYLQLMHPTEVAETALLIVTSVDGQVPRCHLLPVMRWAF